MHNRNIDAIGISDVQSTVVSNLTDVCGERTVNFLQIRLDCPLSDAHSSIDVTNVNAIMVTPHISKSSTETPDIMVLRRKARDALIDYCKRNDIKLIAHSDPSYPGMVSRTPSFTYRTPGSPPLHAYAV